MIDCIEMLESLIKPLSASHLGRCVTCERHTRVSANAVKYCVGCSAINNANGAPNLCSNIALLVMDREAFCWYPKSISFNGSKLVHYRPSTRPAWDALEHLCVSPPKEPYLFIVMGGSQAPPRVKAKNLRLNHPHETSLIGMSGRDRDFVDRAGIVRTFVDLDNVRTIKTIPGLDKTGSIRSGEVGIDPQDIRSMPEYRFFVRL